MVRFPGDVRIAVETVLMLAWVRLALRLMPRRVLRGVLTPAAGAADRGQAAEIGAVFQRVARRHPLAHTCMHRALALQRVLARRGIAATLRIGLGRRPQLLPGHAWLEVDGMIVNDDPEVVARYIPLTISETALGTAYR